MALRGSPAPEKINDSLVRSKDVVQVFDNFKVSNTSEHESDAVPCREYREFLLYLGIDSTGAPTTIQVKIKYLDPWTGKWHMYKQGFFASLFYEDTDTANGINECFSGPILGSQMKVSLTGVGASGSAYFNVDTALEFRN